MQRTIKTLIVVPENNTTMEPEISVLCPALAPIPVARVKRPPRTLRLEDLTAYGEATLDAIEPYADEQFDLVIYGCTAAGFLGGPGRQRRHGGQIARAHRRERREHRRRHGGCFARGRYQRDHRSDALSAAGQRRPARLS